MSKKASGSGIIPPSLPSDFFDSDKKSKKAHEDDLAKELEEFEKEMAALQAESDEKLREEFEKLQDEKNLDELDQQLDQWKRIVELEKRAEELKNKPISENPTKRFKNDESFKIKPRTNSNLPLDNDQDLDDIEDFEDKLSNWRSKGL